MTHCVVTYSLPGPPLTNDTALAKLLESGVIVGIGVRDAWEARNMRFDLKWVSSAVESPLNMH